VVSTFRRVSVHLQYYQCTEWIVYKFCLLLISVGHRIKPHKITPTTGNERGVIEINDYVILTHGEDDRSSPHTLVVDVTMTHDHYERTFQCTNGTLTHRVSSTGDPQSDGTLNNVTRIKIRYYSQIYSDTTGPDPIVFLLVSMNTSGRVYDDFTRLFFLHAYREARILTGE
jgi:hypothetical protein